MAKFSEIDFFFNFMATEFAEKEEKEQTLVDIADSIRVGLFRQQRDLVEDPARRKSALCPRRSGKSWTAMSYAHEVCLRQERAKVVIITLTLKSAKNIYWFEMKDFANHYGIHCEYFSNEMRVHFTNGSQIMLIGAESQAQIDKLRGGKYDLVIVDECKSYPPLVLTELLDDVVWPALSDRKGTLLLIGTPGNILEGPFFDATYPGAKTVRDNKDVLYSRDFYNPERYWLTADHNPQWSRHYWHRQDNIFVPHLWEEALETKQTKGWDDDNPSWLREYLGQWVPAEASFVYSYATLVRTSPEKVNWKPIPNKTVFGLPKNADWRFLLGLDLGFQDDTAAVIAAYNPNDGTLFHVWDYKSEHMDVDQVAQLIARAHELVEGEFDAIVADMGGLGTQIIETFRRRYGWNIHAAEKKEKFDFIELMNTDWHAGRVKVLRQSDLSTELQALQWDLGRGGKELLARTGRLREHPSLPNHLCDAFLYIWRFSYHFWSEPRIVSHPYGSQEWHRDYEIRVKEHMVNTRDDEQNRTFWEELEAFNNEDPFKDLV